MNWGEPMVFALFEPEAELTALFCLGAVVVWGLAHSQAPRWTGGPIGLVALGLALFMFPTMWRTMDIAF